ncbi:hypothetical protein C8A01DRAFT_18366 [Parachaetomium inaequale]|uniref:Heme oxygenase n=1 Tax=Parachaetomium inaequale TaxID=2588326 RepID=A0AAN6SPJ8_9PEZI|nr:hypothetical protein C8A01DRAFT_18366 [Parachaetomium inaequale]
MDLQDSTPGAQARPHLGDSINVATRALHTKLNKAILQHFPLALPPHARNPSVYVSGLLHIAPIYLTFESLWHDILNAHHNHDTTNLVSEHHHPFSTVSSSSEGAHPTPPSSPFSDNSKTTPTSSLPPNPAKQPSRIHALLHNLYSPLLTRSPALLADIRAITNWSDATLRSKLAALTTQREGGGNDEGKGTGGRQKQQHLTTFLAHLRHAVAARPHLLLAYAWVLYMALFSGGRVLRGVLEGVGEGFWRAAVCDSVLDDVPPRGGQPDSGRGTEGMPLGFFRFDTAQDGEDLKEEFKKKFEEAGRALTVDEWAEVVSEAGRIFEHMILLVGELHDMLGQIRSLSGASPGSSVSSWAGRFAGLALGNWIRGGRAVKQRGEEAVGGGEPARNTGKEDGNEPADGFGAMSLVVALLMAGVGLGVRYAWK